jgi:hypothetical protein
MMRRPFPAFERGHTRSVVAVVASVGVAAAAGVLTGCVDGDRCSGCGRQEYGPSLLGDQPCQDLFALAVFGGILLIAAIWKALSEIGKNA